MLTKLLGETINEYKSDPIIFASTHLITKVLLNTPFTLIISILLTQQITFTVFELDGKFGLKSILTPIGCQTV